MEYLRAHVALERTDALPQILDHSVGAVEELQLLRCQYLRFYTSRASKLSTCTEEALESSLHQEAQSPSLPACDPSLGDIAPAPALLCPAARARSRSAKSASIVRGAETWLMADTWLVMDIGCVSSLLLAAPVLRDKPEMASATVF